MIRFTIRDILWLTVVVALAAGWGIHAVRSAALRKERNALRSKFDAVVGIARDTAQLNIEEDGEAIRVSMPRGWPQSLTEAWQPLPKPTGPVAPGVEYPIARRR